jgi:hypothetical protein
LLKACINNPYGGYIVKTLIFNHWANQLKLLTHKAKLRQLRYVNWGIEQSRGHKPNNQIKRRPSYKSFAETVRAPKLLQYHVPRQTRYIFEAFIKDIELKLIQGRTVFIDFSDTIRLYPCGLLLLMGLVEAWNDLFPGKLKANYPSDDRVC